MCFLLVSLLTLRIVSGQYACHDNGYLRYFWLRLSRFNHYRLVFLLSYWMAHSIQNTFTIAAAPGASFSHPFSRGKTLSSVFPTFARFVLVFTFWTSCWKKKSEQEDFRYQYLHDPVASWPSKSIYTELQRTLFPVRCPKYSTCQSRHTAANTVVVSD